MVQPRPGALSRRRSLRAPRGAYPYAGQDVTNSTGTAVYAAAAGAVIRRGTAVLSGRTGNGLVISHGSGRYTYYGHLGAFRVPLDARVAAGQRIADMGAAGHVTGPHLHFETHSGGLGSTVNPVSCLAARGVDLGGGWPEIGPGAVGATVKAVQYLITRHGAALVADGMYGSVSANAVKRFQFARGLAADGQVGPKTWPGLLAPAGQLRSACPRPPGGTEQAQRETRRRRRLRLGDQRRRPRLPERQPPRRRRPGGPEDLGGPSCSVHGGW